MGNRNRQYWGTAFVLLTLLLLFFQGVIAKGSGGVFHGWLQFAYNKALPPHTVLQITMARHFFWLGLAGILVLAFILNRLNILKLRIGKIIWLWLGALVLIFWMYLPMLLSFPFMQESNDEWSNIYQSFISYPNLVFLLGFVLVLAGVPNRWLVWRNAFVLFLLAVWLTIPLIRIFYPDFYFEGDVWSTYSLFAIVFIVSLAAYYLVAPVLWPKASEARGVSPSVDDVAPGKGLTVREISKGIDHIKGRSFLFGAIDQEVVRKWGMIGQAILALSATRRRRFMVSAVSLLVWPLLVYELSGGSDGEYERDVVAMWQTRTLPDGSVVSTKQAMTAARRVFGNEKELIGLTRDEVEDKLRMDMMKPAYQLNKPLYSWQEDQFTVRIGDGRDSRVLLLGYDREGRVVVVLNNQEYYPVK